MQKVYVFASSVLIKKPQYLTFSCAEFGRDKVKEKSSW